MKSRVYKVESWAKTVLSALKVFIKTDNFLSWTVWEAKLPIFLTGSLSASAGFHVI
jgi:hypothetical protein